MNYVCYTNSNRWQTMEMWSKNNLFGVNRLRSSIHGFNCRAFLYEYYSNNTCSIWFHHNTAFFLYSSVGACNITSKKKTTCIRSIFAYFCRFSTNSIDFKRTSPLRIISSYLFSVYYLFSVIQNIIAPLILMGLLREYSKLAMNKWFSSQPSQLAWFVPYSNQKLVWKIFRFKTENSNATDQERLQPIQRTKVKW